jgi:hypothetical protein
MLPIFLIPEGRHLAHWEFFLLAAAIALGTIGEMGLLGNGAWAKAASVCGDFALVGWFVFRVRKEDFSGDSIAFAHNPSA